MLMETNVITMATDASHIDEAKAESEQKPGPCPVIKAVDQIASKWRLVVLHDLQDGEKRFNELEDSTEASSRTLSRVLDDLEEMGFVDRRMEEAAPVATYYSLTEKGEALCPVFDEIEAWSEEWVETRQSAK
jgi:DNA-binding HxlR family transcriptional regulator